MRRLVTYFWHDSKKNVRNDLYVMTIKNVSIIVFNNYIIRIEYRNKHNYTFRLMVGLVTYIDVYNGYNFSALKNEIRVSNKRGDIEYAIIVA
jgi:hypothetical protein